MRGRAGFWPVLTVLVLFVLILLAAAIQGPLTFRPAETVPEEVARSPEPSASGTSLEMPTPTPLEPNPVADVIGRIVFILLLLLAGGAFLAVVALALRTLMRAWRARPLRRREGAMGGTVIDAPVAAAAPAEIEAEQIRRGIAAALDAIDARPSPADAIVAAWIGLEESAADAGLTRGASETPAEFTLRIVTRRAGIAGEAERLLRLYERVRFGDHQAGEEDRAAAKSALEHIQEGWR